MKGSIRKLGKSYQYRVSYNTNGKRHQIEKSGFKTKKECEIAMNKVIAEINNTGSYAKVKDITIETLFNEFIIKECPLNRKESTIKRYKSLFKNHIEPYFKNRYMQSISALEIQEFYLITSSKTSVNYVRSMHNLLLVLFDFALRMNYIKVNVMNNVKNLKKPKDNEIRIYTKQEINWMLERSANTSIQSAIMLGLHLGIRAGECYALRWSDFNFENNTVKIDKQLQNVNNVWCFDTLKTENSYRTLKFGNVLRDYLLNLKHQQELLKRKVSPINRVMDIRNNKKEILIIDDFINLRHTGEMLRTDSHKVFSRICKKESDIDFKFHNLRHTHATILLENGLNPKYIQERLGHSKLDFTLKVYTHITTKMNDQCASILDNNLL